MRDFAHPETAHAWHFLTGRVHQIKRVTDAVELFDAKMPGPPWLRTVVRLTVANTGKLPRDVIRAVALLVGIAQILRMSSVARFHCETVSAIMLVDFMAAWLSWA